jgi:hypothetical protein
MKKFIILIIVTLFTTLIVSLAYDFAFTYVYKNSNPRSKFQYLRSLKNTKINYIFLGSSRVDNGIVPSIIENKSNKTSLNLGFQYSLIGDIYYSLKLLKEYNITSDSIFIQVDYMYNQQKGFSNNLPYEMSPFIRDNSVTKEYTIDYVGQDQSNYYVPFYRYCSHSAKIGFREVVSNLVNKKKTVQKYKGFSPMQGIENQKQSHRVLPETISNSNVYFDKIKNYCKNNNIKVIFFCAPFCKHTENLDYISKLKIKIPELYDFSNAINDDKMFVNCYHLNEKGAEKFTEIFVSKIILSK